MLTVADPQSPDSPPDDDRSAAAAQAGDPSAPRWREFFPYDEPYPEQVDAIEKIRETAADGGFALFEGACGTGKTLVSLMTGLSLVRDPATQYERVLCLTSVNQQLGIFQSDVQAINDRLRATGEDDAGLDPVRGLTLIGKGKVCSYTDTGHIDPERENVHERCDQLREPVRTVLENAEDTAESIGRLQSLVETARADVGETTLTQHVDGGLSPADGSWTAPYGNAIPDMPDSNRETQFCPFYAESRLEGLEADAAENPLAIDHDGMLTPADVREYASDRGWCPHMSMHATMEDAEVVVGNYYHAFDPVTVAVVTEAILDERTFLVADEAHMLVERVRDLLSDAVSRRSITEATGELRTQLLERAFDERGTVRETPEARRILDLLDSLDIDPSEVRAFARFLEEANGWLADRAVETLQESVPDWRERWHADLPAEVEGPLRDPERPASDEFSEWVAERGYGDLAERARSLGSEIAALLTDERFPTGHSKRETAVDSVGRALTRWWQADNTQYFRTVTLDRRSDPATNQDLAWEEHYTAHLRLHNCLPSQEIAARLGEFGGGVLMSATLAPFDEYGREVGVRALGEDRDVRELAYGLSFPAENRTSLALKTTPFTFENRGYYDPGNPPSDPLFNRVREEYGQVVKTVVRTTPGNVLVGMPSYAEAAWAAHVLEDAGVEKPVLVDESSTNDATESLKDDFFSGEGKVLVTSLRGTLTEGVDYDGDKLAACLVCGVPIQNVNGALPKAIQTAYETEFGESRGFELAFTVPAVRKARQALGRVIRGEEEVGVRILADERYATSGTWNSVREMLPDHERAEFQPAGTMLYADHLETFWSRATPGQQDR